MKKFARLPALLVMLFCSAALSQDLPKIAICVTGEATKDLKTVFAKSMLTSLSSSGRYSGDEYINIRSGAVGDSLIRELGRQSGVRFICVADITPFSGEYLITARIIEAETARAVAVADADSPLRAVIDIREASDKLARIMLSARGTPVVARPRPEPPRQPPAPPPPPAPMPTPVPDPVEDAMAVLVKRSEAANKAVKDAEAEEQAAKKAAMAAIWEEGASAALVAVLEERVVVAEEIVRRAKAEAAEAAEALRLARAAQMRPAVAPPTAPAQAYVRPESDAWNDTYRERAAERRYYGDAETTNEGLTRTTYYGNAREEEVTNVKDYKPFQFGMGVGTTLSSAGGSGSSFGWGFTLGMILKFATSEKFNIRVEMDFETRTMNDSIHEAALSFPVMAYYHKGKFYTGLGLNIDFPFGHTGVVIEYSNYYGEEYLKRSSPDIGFSGGLGFMFTPNFAIDVKGNLNFTPMYRSSSYYGGESYKAHTENLRLVFFF